MVNYFKYKRLAYYDMVCGCNNRNYLEDKLVKKFENKSTYITIIDIDDLKIINDTLGHQAGDEYIRKACRMICDIFGHSPVYRIGGDEFVLLTSSGDRAYAEGLQQKILAMNGQLIPYKEAEVPLKLYADLVKVDAGNLKYAELFPKLVISQEKKEEVL